MKPKYIILVRHGESQGNVNKKIYESVPDYALDLTDKGKQQAHEAGKKIREFLSSKNIDVEKAIQFYCSPFWRTRRTYQEIIKSFPLRTYYEDARLREQEWSGSLRKDFRPDTETERDSYGHFYYRLPNGESCADVYDRVSDFFNTLHRDFQKNDFPNATVIVTHGMTFRLFVMRWFHLSVEEFESLANPKNCEFHILELQPTGRYKLITTMKKYPTYQHPYQFKW